MLVTLVRHGIAMDPAEPGCPPDRDRPLTRKGVRRTRLAARGLRALGVKADLLLTSPLLRAAQTARILAEVLRIPAARMRETESLEPGASPKAILAELRRVQPGSPLLVGHAPSLDWILASLVGSPEPLTSLKKAGAACVEVASTLQGQGRLVWLCEAGTLRALA